MLKRSVKVKGRVDEVLKRSVKVKGRVDEVVEESLWLDVVQL